MIEIKNFDNWIEDKVSGKFGSGASEKIWLINPETNEKALFKFPKVKSDGTITGEYWAEKLATEIGKLIGVECARVDIGTYKGRIGSMSYNILENKYDNLFEGIYFIQKHYPYYNKSKLEDTYSNIKYSIQMIEKSILEDYYFDIRKIYKMIIFDILIGNSDRHHSNWAIKHKKTIENNMIHVTLDLCPLYDNGSSLCAYEDNNNLDIFFKDKMKFEALVNTKSKSTIGWENERPIRHFELLSKLKENSYLITLPYIENIKNNINEQSIDKLLKEFDNNIINNDMKRLLKMFLLERRKRMLEIYDIID